MQLVNIKKMCTAVNQYLNKPKTVRALQTLAILSLAGLATQVFADAATAGPTDLLAGTEANLLKTLNETGKKYLYIAEGVVSLIAYISTKNVAVLVGIIVVAVFFNIMIKMAAS